FVSNKVEKGHSLYANGTRELKSQERSNQFKRIRCVLLARMPWRGTVTNLEWMEDLMDFLKPVSAQKLANKDPNIKVDKDQSCEYSKFSAPLGREGVGEGWKRFVYALEGVYDKDIALEKIRNLKGYDDGNSLSNLLWWIHSRDDDDHQGLEGGYKHSCYRSKEDEVLKISTSVFVTNFLDSFDANDLWNTCKQYGHVVDAYIPYRRSKASKRFGFVRFIKVLDVDRLVNNLCTVWVGRHKLHANILRFQREHLNKHSSLHNDNKDFNPRFAAERRVYPFSSKFLDSLED
ncbi:nucleotide-binding alpha-beta plait domain-containing protein, partial [Tanacetum coccineum]